MIPDDQLDEMERVVNGTTPGPWAWLPNDGQFIVDDKFNVVAEVPCTVGNHADGEFIASARTWIPELIAEIRRLRKEAS